MKTTIELPEPLFRRAKIYAARRKTTMKELVIEGLKRVVDDFGVQNEAGFSLTKEEQEVVTIGANGLPLLLRAPGTRKRKVTEQIVNQIRDELSI
jgi:hypothetical protein